MGKRDTLPETIDAEFDVIEPGRKLSPPEEFAYEYAGWKPWIRVLYWVAIPVCAIMALGVGFLVRTSIERLLAWAGV